MSHARGGDVSAPDFVAIGHITLDRFGDVVRPGGAALYAAVTAARMGLSAGILTSVASDYPLEAIPPDIEVIATPSPASTVFEYETGPSGRVMRVRTRARPLSPADLPGDWGDPGLVLLAPVMNEVDPAFATVFSWVGSMAATAQGWLRRFGADGVVALQSWTPPGFLLGAIQAIFVSNEDIRGHEAQALQWFQRVPIGVVTAGREGAVLYVNGERYHVRPFRVHERDATGAGDVFAAAFLIEYQLEGDAWQAAAAASCAAALSVEGEGFSAVPDVRTLRSALADHRPFG